MNTGRSILTGLAEHLDAAGVGVWRPDTPYEASETAIFLSITGDQPDRAITLALYPLGTNGSGSVMEMGLQVRVRGDRSDPMSHIELQDATYTQLQALSNTTLPNGVRLSRCLHAASTTPAQDDNQRVYTYDNFELLVHRPTKNTRP